ncbi:XyeA family putative rSAM-modified RiPP [Xenorhabdus bovienii]|uniref:XyeA family cyclophane-containing RiPP triceptide n=1 Tax=Xenorhabdus bovienii TaxID=40576 RepID=UPI0023B21156|nr:XyeA family cyclophane-containing RiPP triceptide [Xenorhabdus bovienii]MDE9427560.1 XyeA family putative rSAM-modified RiPP [Xenorhabdus bovienii]MDE9437716.1 XyeA family putative rSAM-modified RiPP [Xenorhabdus bovienii]MDE9466524.1 XyeA family putative rSAM-modified RiPP [Xenorhabdus bovienii]MDE9499854.1 XyeA family putative rSAM-modified RiPP [Xenorhabdus bovienii]MDE9536874.1 XyeA family putative rSAM-modified RiPP [Xenorhabdus bovienii]
MSKLQREIALNNAQVIKTSEKKQERKVLVENLMDSVSGGWVNVFARWDKAI